MGFIMLHLAQVVRQFPAWFQPLKAHSAFGSFSPVCRPYFKAGVGMCSKITPLRLRSLISQLSFFLVPNVVLSKMNNHEHRKKQTYEG